MGTGITVNCRVKNEERFVRAAIESVLPLADHVLVCDNGSADRTLEEIAAIGSDKIEIVHKPPAQPRELTGYRNEMADRCKTAWFMVVDGDEIYPRRSVQRIIEVMAQVPPSIHRIVMNRRHFAGSYNFLSGIDGLARIYRQSKVRHGIASQDFTSLVGHETPYLIDNPSTPWGVFSMRMPRDVFFFHCQFLQRSSHDHQMGRLRGWRRPPFPVRPFFGPWPETLRADGLERRMTPALWSRWLSVNQASIARGALRQMALRAVRRWPVRRWPPEGLLIWNGETMVPWVRSARASRAKDAVLVG